MKSLLQKVSLPVAALALTLFGQAAIAQSIAQTPLTQAIQANGSINPSRPSNCGFLADSAAQVLQVNEDFASVNIAVSGSSGLTLFIEGPNGFTECHTTSGATGTVNAPGLMNQGRYTFYVGNTNPVPTSYTLTLSQN
jgi:hypothetical protein